MTPWIHSAVLATTFIATAAVGVAGASIYMDGTHAAPKGDRLTVAAPASDVRDYITVETRSDGVSVLRRVAIE